MALLKALRQMAWTLIALLVVSGARAQKLGPAHSDWARLDGSGRLVYQHLKTGERILDFSYAGYMGGGVALPTPPVKATVSPSGGDDTAAMQAAIDQVSNLPPADGVRGAVLLTAGHFRCNATLRIAASGVVLRGSGSGENDT